MIPWWSYSHIKSYLFSKIHRGAILSLADIAMYSAKTVVIHIQQLLIIPMIANRKYKDYVYRKMLVQEYLRK